MLPQPRGWVVFCEASPPRLPQPVMALPPPTKLPGTATSPARFGKPEAGWRERLYIIIFEADTPAGKLFDLCLIAAIVASVSAVIVDSISTIALRIGTELNILEWFFTVLFTVEYLARLACVRHPMRYATSLFGIIDLLAILPTYIAIFVPEAYALLDVRILRLLRIFRILKLASYVAEYNFLLQALAASRRKILIFLSFVLIVVLLLGTAMYVIEGPENGFTSIPTAVYWAVTAVTTVGFGDIVPKTDLGRAIASIMMLLGWGTLAVPTGILTAEMTSQRRLLEPTTRTCPECLTDGHEPKATFCWHCGFRLPPYQHG